MVRSKTFTPERIEGDTVVFDKNKFISIYFHNDFDDVAVDDMYGSVDIDDERYSFDEFVIGNYSCRRSMMQPVNEDADFVEWEFTPKGWNTAKSKLSGNLKTEVDGYTIKWE